MTKVTTPNNVHVEAMDISGKDHSYKHAKTSNRSFCILLLATIWKVFGCGVIPASQASTRTFTVTGLRTVPVAMAYAGKPEVSARVPGIAANEAGAKGFVERLVMQTVFDVLERQGRSALLPEAVISAILGQLEVRVIYAPIQCQGVVLNPAMDMVMKNEQKCIIVGNTVTGFCNGLMGLQRAMMPCTMPVDMMVAITPIPQNHTTISGTLSTTNIVMASWSRSMWQSVVDRALRV
ncbi:hypothetical protein KIN20_011484, partial [Parelaphostrongylus tenuis]